MIWLRQTLKLITKELLQLLRDRPLLFFLIYIFTFNVMLAGSERSSDLTNARVIVYDADHSEASRDLIYRFQPPKFRFVGEVANPKQGFRALEKGDATLFIQIPEKFQEQLVRHVSPVHVQALVDTSRATTGFLAASYASRISGQFSQEWSSRISPSTARLSIPTVQNEARVWFNPEINIAWFSSLAELLMMLTIASMLIPCSAVVREKEKGTIEQLLVSPLSPFQMIISKAIATAIVMVIGTTFCLYIVMHGMFRVPIRGSALLFLGMTALYALTNAGVGFVMSTFARNSGQSGMLLLLVAMPMIMLSGTWTPRESMPGILKTTVDLFPMRHFIDISYAILFRGADMSVIAHSVVWMVSLGVVLFLIGLLRFRRQFA